MTKALLISLAVFAVAVVLVNPVGDFPLNDDWSYGSAVKGLVEQGVYRLSDWTAMPLLTQVLWGSLFSLPAGFSFTALRFSTLAMSLLALVFLFQKIQPVTKNFVLLLKRHSRTVGQNRNPQHAKQPSSQKCKYIAHHVSNPSN